MQISRVWDGNAAGTRLFHIDNSIDWESMLDGTKTQLRSIDRLTGKTKLPALVMATHNTSFVPFVVTSSERMLLGLIDDDGVRAEGYSDIPSFKRFWCSKNGVSHFSQHERVWAYEFYRYDPSFIKDDDSTLVAMRTLVENLYPLDLE